MPARSPVRPLTEVVEEPRREGEEGHLDLGDIHDDAVAGAAAVEEGGGEGGRRVAGRHRVGHGPVREGGIPVRPPGEGEVSRQGGPLRPVAGVVRMRPPAPPHRGAQYDQVGLVAGQLGRAEPPTGQGGRCVVLDHRVGPINQPESQGPGLRSSHVDRHAALAGVDVGEEH